jgi:hypothetical protein
MNLFVPTDTAFGDSDVRTARHLTVTQAGDLLDWLEAHGIQAREVQIEPDGYILVRWQSAQRAA